MGYLRCALPDAMALSDCSQGEKEAMWGGQSLVSSPFAAVVSLSVLSGIAASVSAGVRSPLQPPESRAASGDPTLQRCGAPTEWAERVHDRETVAAPDRGAHLGGIATSARRMMPTPTA